MFNKEDKIMSSQLMIIFGTNNVNKGSTENILVKTEKTESRRLSASQK